MKHLHRSDMFCWSVFDEARNIDFNSYVWKGPQATVVTDPMPMSEHDLRHLRELGDVDWIVVTNSDHIRWARELQQATGAKVAGPSGEEATMDFRCDRWLTHGDTLVEGLEVIEVHGSKTPAELALLIQGCDLITGDLVRSTRPGTLHLLPDEKLTNRVDAIAAVEVLAARGVRSVLVGDGWPIFSEGAQALDALMQRLQTE